MTDEAHDASRAPVDGRRLRREKNREAVLDAVVTLFEQGDIDPQVEAVAREAGVSTRSVYRYFTERDELIRAAIVHAMARVARELTVPEIGRGAFAERVRRFVDHRIAMYLRLAPITRAARVAAASEPAIAEEFELGRMILRQQFVDHFDAELRRVAPERRTDVVTLAELPFLFDSFEYLWQVTDGDRARMGRLLVEQLTRDLGDHAVAAAAASVPAATPSIVDRGGGYGS